MAAWPCVRRIRVLRLRGPSARLSPAAVAAPAADDALKRVNGENARVIQFARALVITLGSAMGVDSSLPDNTWLFAQARRAFS